MLRATEFGQAPTVQALWTVPREWILESVRKHGYDIALFAIAAVVGQQDITGDLTSCHDTLLIGYEIGKDIISECSFGGLRCFREVNTAEKNPQF